MMAMYRDIEFGYTSAEAERSSDPGLLMEGYVDLRHASQVALEGRHYLFLGHKGTGKSAIAEHIRLKSEGDPLAFVKLIVLSDFPFTPFSKIVRGNMEPESKFPSAWSWILLIYLLESFDEDHGATHDVPERFSSAVEAFRVAGLSPAADPGAIVRQCSKKGFRFKLPGGLAEYSDSEAGVKALNDIPDFVESLKQVLCGIRSRSKHYLIIDGLDDVVTSRNIQNKSISALIFEVGRLNAMFSQAGVPVKIILLCRTDMFEWVPGPNKNKIRQDFANELDWYSDPSDPDSSELIRIANMRCKRSLGEGFDLFREFFPGAIHNNPISSALLEMTRHTPRDFLRLLHYIQKYWLRHGKISLPAINSGMRAYSIRYFLPEIRDELSGHASPAEIAAIVEALGRVGKRDFRLGELIDASRAGATPLEAEKVHDVVNSLFQCSALGNIQREGGRTHYTFKYRNRHSSFNEGKTIMLHRGLWKALNLS